jgi:hypothetical protein
MGISMKKITVQLSPEELQVLVTLTDNQFFRMKFIDPKMPGYKAQPEKLRTAQSGVQVLKNALNKVKGHFVQTEKVAAAAAARV